MRQLIGPAVATFALLAAACGSSTPSANSAEVKAVAASVSDGGFVTAKQATCIAQKAVPDLSSKGVALVKKKGSDPSELSSPDQRVIYASVDSCVTTAQLVPGLSRTLQSGTNKIDATAAKCFTKGVVAAYPKAGDLMKAAITGKTAKLTGVMEACLPASSIKEQLIEALTTNGALTTAQASCVADKVVAEVPQSDFAKIGESGSLPADIESKIQTDATACMASS